MIGVFVGFLASTYYHYIFLVQDSFDPTKVSSLNNPLSTFLPSGVARFCDFYGITKEWIEKNQFYGVGYQNVYFPSAYLFVNIFSNANQFLSLVIYLFIFSAYMLICAYCLIFKNCSISAVNQAHGCLLVFITYPFLFSFYTANFEIISFILLGLFFINYFNKRFNVSALFLGLSVSMKLFPGVFLVYLLIKKQYLLALKALFVAIAGSIVALVVFRGGAVDDSIFGYIARLMESQKMHTQLFVTEVGVGYRYGHSLLNTVSSFLRFKASNLIVQSYAVLMLLCFVTLSAILHAHVKSNFKLIAAFVSMMLLFPITSQDYKLLYVFIPLVIYINIDRQLRFEKIYFFVFLFLIIPKDYLYFYNDPYVNTNNLLNTICLIILLGLSFIPEKIDETRKNIISCQQIQ